MLPSRTQPSHFPAAAGNHQEDQALARGRSGIISDAGNSVHNQESRPTLPSTSLVSHVSRAACASHTLLPGFLLLNGVFLALGFLLAMAGCAKKITKTGVPFDLDIVFRGKPPVVEDSSKEKGIRLAKERKFPEAIEAFTQHVREEPENFSGFNAIAVCYKNMGDHANAMKNFERALEFADSPEEQAKILANIGNLYYVANKPQVALGYYKEATTLFDKNPLYLILIARTFVALQEHDRARRVLATAEQVDKDLEKYERDDERGLGSYLMAYCYLALNDEEKVFHHIENALKANPGRYVSRFSEDANDPTSPLYTLKGDRRFEKILKTYSTKTSADLRHTERQ